MLLPEHTIARHSSCLFIPQFIGEQASPTFHQLINVAHRAPVIAQLALGAFGGEQGASTVAGTGDQAVVILGLNSLQTRLTNESNGLHI